MVRPGTTTITTQQPTQGPRPSKPKPVTNGKFVCGVKGTNRELRSLSITDGANSTLDHSLSSGMRTGRVVGGSDALPGEFCWQVNSNQLQDETPT